MFNVIINLIITIFIGILMTFSYLMYVDDWGKWFKDKKKEKK